MFQGRSVNKFNRTNHAHFFLEQLVAIICWSIMVLYDDGVRLFYKLHLESAKVASRKMLKIGSFRNNVEFEAKQSRNDCECQRH